MAIKRMIRPAISLVIALVLILTPSLSVNAALPGVEDNESYGVYNASVILDSYSVLEGSLVAGERVKLEFLFRNPNVLTAVNDLVITYKTASNRIYPVFGESNTSYVPDIQVGEEVRVEKEFIVSREAPQTTDMVITLQYRSALSGLFFQTDVTITLPIFGMNSFRAQVDIADSAFVNVPMVVGGFCNNTGTRDLGDLTLILSGNIEGGRREVDMGDLSSGAQIYFSETVTFPRKGEAQNLSVAFRFSDEDGNEVLMPANDYAISVTEQVTTPLIGDNAPNEESLPISIPGPISAIVVGVCLVVGLIILIRYLRARR